MGLIKAGMGAVGGVLADQWKEFIYCESMPPNILVQKGQKRLSSQGRSSNTTAEDNIISNGSVISVNVGQCMLIVESGKVVDFCAEPGEFVYDKSTEPSLFQGGELKDNVIAVFKQIGKRFTFGGDPGKDQRVYYFNLKEIIGNKYGTPSAIPFKVVEKSINFEMTTTIKCFGEYSYKIVDPILFYTNVCNNVSDAYDRSNLDGQLKTELLTALGPTFGFFSGKIGYDELPMHNFEIADKLNEILSKKWRDLRGIEVVSFGISSVKAREEDEEALREMQRTHALNNPGLAAAYSVQAAGRAMNTAAANTAGAMTGFMGMGMAQGMGGGMNPAGMFQQAQMQQQPGYGMQPQYQAGVGYGQPQAPQAPAGWTCSCGQTGNTGKFCANCGGPKPEPKPAAGAWKCSCGTENTGKFCANCGSPKPAEQEGWTCSCGTVNKGKFCANCGSKKPAGAPLYKCDKCGWQPEDPTNPPKFCPECGDIFDDNDKI
ncbi:MAG: SPFH domain-containing protein [Phascolarctobacterium sp.]|nr:SPFH domain-containing protein [Phascolarctobacterium sp.]